jgi:hypothetical protein
MIKYQCELFAALAGPQGKVVAYSRFLGLWPTEYSIRLIKNVVLTPQEIKQHLFKKYKYL